MSIVLAEKHPDRKVSGNTVFWLFGHIVKEPVSWTEISPEQS